MEMTGTQLWWLILLAMLILAYVVSSSIESRQTTKRYEDNSYKEIRLRELDVEILKAGGTLPDDDNEEEFGHA